MQTPVAFEANDYVRKGFHFPWYTLYGCVARIGCCPVINVDTRVSAVEVQEVECVRNYDVNCTLMMNGRKRWP